MTGPVHTLRRSALPLLLALQTACGTAPPAAPPRAAPAVPATFGPPPEGWSLLAPADHQPRGAWWQVFGDPRLDQLVEQALAHNLDIHQVASRWQQAQALLGQAQAPRGLQAGVDAGLDRQGGPLRNAAGSSGTLLTLSAPLAYEVDLSGRLARAADAAGHDLQAEAALLQATRLMVQAQVAHQWLALRTRDAERQLARRLRDSHREAVRLAEVRQRSGSLSASDLAAPRAARAEAEAELVRIGRAREEHHQALALLLGRPLQELPLPDTAPDSAPDSAPKAATDAVPATVPTAASHTTPPTVAGAAQAGAAWLLPAVPAGIPSAVLARRPDVAAALRQLRAAEARVDESRAAWFPNLSLTAFGGQASADLVGLLGAATRAWGLGALLTLPLLDGGRREALQAQAQALQDERRAAYHRQILVAFQEVEAQLLALRSLADEATLQQHSLQAARQTAAGVTSRLRQGLASQIEQQQAERGVLLMQRQALQLQAAQAQATVGLIRALGGGWGRAG